MTLDRFDSNVDVILLQGNPPGHIRHFKNILADLFDVSCIFPSMLKTFKCGFTIFQVHEKDSLLSLESESTVFILDKLRVLCRKMSFLSTHYYKLNRSQLTLCTVNSAADFY